jgi:hypothetical protein
MTDAVHNAAKTKAQIMADVQAAVTASVLTTKVLVANPWPNLNQKNLVMKAGYFAWAPDTLGPGEQQKPIPDQAKVTLPAAIRGLSDTDIYAARRKTYLSEGGQRLLAAGKTSSYGTCLDISCLVVTLLGSTFRTLFRSTSVLEVCTMTTAGQSAHVLVVVNRAPGSKLSDSTTWGTEAFIVDQWYALQRNTPRGAQAVKDLDPTSPFYDQEFIDFFTTSRLGKPQTLARRAVFTGADFAS